MLRLRIALMWLVTAALVAIAVLPVPGWAQGSPAATSEQARRDEIQAAAKAAMQAGTRGPADIKMIDQAVLTLPAGYVFIPKAEGARFMRALGNTISDTVFVGLIVGTNPGDDWIVDAEYIKDGYIKDDEAKNWDADKLLQSLKDGTEADNKNRVARGFPELQVLDWVERPTYDSATRRLVWSVLLKTKDEPDSAPKSINYNTYALGRDGYFSLNLLTSSDKVANDKVAAHHLLSALSYNPGKRYEDFDASTDHIAEYGIAALIGGIAAKKLGLFALIAVFAAKFAKVIFLGVVAFGAGIWNFIRGRRTRSAAPNAE
jgi:uncharacterized membrane-anchored protein